jgi:hypothetical protein
VFISPVDLSPTVQKSPILDLVDANISHYQAQFERTSSLHYSGQSTPVISGWPDGAPATFQLGSNNLWLLPTGASAEILESRGTALEHLRQEVADEEVRIADLGARLVHSAANGPETAEAARIRQHSQTSVVSSIARTVSDGLKLALEIAVTWSRFEGKVQAELNQDYLDIALNPQLFTALITAYHEGLMVKRDLIWNMKEAELIPPDRSVDDVMEDLEKQGPILLGGRPDPRVMARKPGQRAGDKQAPPAEGAAAEE